MLAAKANPAAKYPSPLSERKVVDSYSFVFLLFSLREVGNFSIVSILYVCSNILNYWKEFYFLYIGARFTGWSYDVWPRCGLFWKLWNVEFYEIKKTGNLCKSEFLHELQIIWIHDVLTNCIFKKMMIIYRNCKKLWSSTFYGGLTNWFVKNVLPICICQCIINI